MKSFIAIAALAALAACSAQGPGRNVGYGLNVPEGAQTPDFSRAATVPRVTTLVIDGGRGREGGIGVEARGSMEEAAPWIGRLIETDRSEGTITYRFVVAPPRTEPPGNVERVREVAAATFLTPNQLRGIERIRVEGTDNAIERKAR